MSECINKRAGAKPAYTKAPVMEWVIAEDDRQWGSVQTTPLAPPAPIHHWGRRWWLASAGALLLLLVVGGWLWHQAHSGLSRIEGELQAAVEADQWQSHRDNRIEATHSGLIQDIAEGEDLAQIAGVHLIELQNEWAIVQVTLRQGTLSYRQTRVYRRDARGWYASTPSVALWGAPRTLETTHFIFHYYALDTKAVAEAATKLDAIYPGLAASYPLEPAGGGKHRIRVGPTYPLQGNRNTSAGVVLEIASPAIYLAPTVLSQGDILAQAVLLGLLDSLTVQSLARQLPNPAHDDQAGVRVADLLRSLQLWQLWSTELPLAALYKPAIQWLYRDVQGEHALPDFDAELCPLHQLWKEAPYAIQIPLFCGDGQQLMRYEVGRYLPAVPPRSLAEIHLFVPTSPLEPYRGLLEAEQVGLATLFDYAATTYGPQSLSTLITNAATLSSWEELIPATFGVSYMEFETGWQAHLRNGYGISGRERVPRPSLHE